MEFKLHKEGLEDIKMKGNNEKVEVLAVPV